MATPEQIKKTYRVLALECHPDKNKVTDDGKFKKVTEAYNLLKKHHNKEQKNDHRHESNNKHNAGFKKRSQWGAPPNSPYGSTSTNKTPEEDWSRFTKEFENENPNFWKEYERKFWEEYNAAMSGNGKEHEEFENTKEPKVEPNLFVDVDPTLCISCCSCETIAPQVFQIDRNSKMNPKSKVINIKGAGYNKIMNAAETCPTKAIIVEDVDKKERIYPF